MRAPLSPRSPRPRGAAAAGSMDRGTGDVPMVRRGKEDMNVRFKNGEFVHEVAANPDDHRTRCGIPFRDRRGYREDPIWNRTIATAAPVTCLECLGAP